MRLTRALRSAWAAYLGGWRGTAVARAPMRFAVTTDSGAQARKAYEAATSEGAHERVECWDGAVRRATYEGA